MDEKIEEIINKTSQFPDSDEDVLVPQREYRNALKEMHDFAYHSALDAVEKGLPEQWWTGAAPRTPYQKGWLAVIEIIKIRLLEHRQLISREREGLKHD